MLYRLLELDFRVNPDIDLDKPAFLLVYKMRLKGAKHGGIGL
jgi:hypothetical protein